MASEPNANGKAPSPKQVHAEVQKQMQVMALKVLGKLKAKSLPDDEIFAKNFPHLWDWLTATQIGEAMAKDPARLIFTCEDGAWKATLSDNALRCSLSAVGLTFDSALRGMEEALGSGDAPWVQWKQRQKALREVQPAEEK